MKLAVISRNGEDKVDNPHFRNESPEGDLLTVRLLDQYRHDWMNEIQLLLGYVRLKKYDKLQQFAQQMMTKAAKESGISALGIPHLTIYLHAFRAYCKTIRLDVELDPELNLNRLPLDSEAAAQTVIGLLDAFRDSALPADERIYELKLRLGLEENALSCAIRFAGEYSEELLKERLQQTLDNCGSMAETRWQSMAGSAEAAIRFRFDK